MKLSKVLIPNGRWDEINYNLFILILPLYYFKNIVKSKIRTIKIQNYYESNLRSTCWYYALMFITNNSICVCSHKGLLCPTKNIGVYNSSSIMTSHSHNLLVEF
jgi:hypothetical protein